MRFKSQSPGKLNSLQICPSTTLGMTTQEVLNFKVSTPLDPTKGGPLTSHVSRLTPEAAA